ncbi:MAG: hypothetical protein FK731_05935 [Asgard group archaeon]|nr:hypothetical protein [Asgard group archaeon]
MPTFVLKKPEVNWDEVLLSGFLTSISDFCDLALNSGNLSNIQFQEKQIFFAFSSNGDFKYVLITKKKMPVDIAEYCLNELQEQYSIFFSKSKKKKITKTQTEKFSKGIAFPTIEKWESEAQNSIKKKSNFSKK